MIQAMREFTKDDQIAVWSDAEVKLLLDLAVARLKASKRVRFRGKKVTQQAVVNAAFVRLGLMAQAELENFMLDCLPRLKEVLESEAPKTKARKTAPSSDDPRHADPLLGEGKPTEKAATSKGRGRKNQ